MPKILIPIPQHNFDPTETAVPWRILKASGFEVYFSTPDGSAGHADQRMLTGENLGIWKSSLKASAHSVFAYEEMALSPEFRKPLEYSGTDFHLFDGLILPGGHAPGMKTYLESEVLQKEVARFFVTRRPIGAICHGVLLAARSTRCDDENKRSVLYDRQVTALPKWMELSAWAMTSAWLGNYYRTYPKSVEDEVKASLRTPTAFARGPMSFSRDDENHLNRGFAVCDQNLVTARWPGDAHFFTHKFMELFK